MTLQEVRTIQGKLLRVVEVLNKLEATNSRNEKEEILEANKDNTLLQRVFDYTYSPYKVYGVGKKTLEGYEQLGVNMTVNKFGTIFDLLDYLTTANLNNDVKGEILSFLATVPPALRDLYVRIMLKDLRVGVTATTVNKVWEGLVPKFDVMLAKKYQDYIDKLKGDIIITTKLDGIRAVIIRERNTTVIMTRQGKIIEGCVQILEEAKKLPTNMVYDGEFLKANPDKLSSKELYNETKKITGKKGEKTGLEYHAFDVIPLDEFRLGKSKKGCLDRKKDLEQIINNGDFAFFKNVPILYVGSDYSKIDELLKEAIANEQEGIMINTAKGKYECKRSKEILKVKKMHTVDLRVVGFEEGAGKYEGMLGRINVEYKGYTVGVGSGFSDADRKEIWENQDKYMGTIVEVQYFEESQNEKKELSLRFPIFLQWRTDKDEPSYD